MMLLYQLDVTRHQDASDAVAEFERQHEVSVGSYGRSLVESVLLELDSLDAELDDLLTEWSISRLGAVERSILRIALVELRGQEVPLEVVIDEAVELARRYASAEAAKLVNGVLGSWPGAKEVEQQGGQAG